MLRRFNGTRLRALIAEAGKSQHDVAVALIQRGYTNCSGSHVGAWCGYDKKPAKRPGPDTMVLLLAVLTEWLGRDVTEEELLHPSSVGAAA
jgi:hypothetical protein